ncbi:OmpA family protein [Parasediminibacterium sp. JCM 36343]|uniref:OmpA family protein n=1 Tax=Parasediminibacterium sp. JCM 36343 TaxID=3374279 RepID=UPI00397967E4
MKRTILSLLALCLLGQTFAQSTSLKRLPSVGFGFFLKDFVTPQSIGATSLNKTWKDKTYAKQSDLLPGASVSYFQGITSHLDFMGQLGGTFAKYSYKNKVTSTKEGFLTDLDAHLNLKLFTDKALINPYLTAGIGGSMYNLNYLMAYAPVGGGIQINVGKGSFLYLQTTYRYHVGGAAAENLNYSIGYASPIVEPKKPKAIATPPPPPVVEKDTDGDGIVDSKDKCPRVAGIAKYDGCPVPDTDKDGINDENDKCPTVAGLAKYNGCPVPDTDGDGINDEEDKCPTVMGLARYMGCPIPDTDGDGVNDEEDKCPTVPGVKSNAGCPEIQTKINELAKSIYFGLGSVIISAKSTKPLDEVAAIMKKYPATKLSIEGHTDNVGSAVINKKLSQKRADAIKTYFFKKGIAVTRLDAIGYGSEKPVADNKTEAGRSKNRRVELKATYQ